MKRRIQMVATKPEEYIDFADESLGSLWANLYGDGVGLTKRQASRILPSQYSAQINGSQAEYVSFDEFKFFTRIKNTGNWANHTSLTSIILPKSCTYVGRFAFDGCSALENINLEGIVTMAVGAFRGCTHLAINVNMPSLRGELEYETFSRSGITKILNLGSATSLGLYSFAQQCTSLTEVWLPKSMKNIGRQTFFLCNALSTVVCLATEPPIAQNTTHGCFDNNASGRKIYVPYSEDHSILNAYKSATGWSRYSSAIFELTEDGELPE